MTNHSEEASVLIAIEHCAMSYSADESAGGKNLPVWPRLWRELFEHLPSKNLGLNYDPSHLVWQFIDPAKPLKEFASRIFHVHAKDARIRSEELQDVGRSEEH